MIQRIVRGFVSHTIEQNKIVNSPDEIEIHFFKHLQHNIKLWSDFSSPFQ